MTASLCEGAGLGRVTVVGIRDRSYQTPVAYGLKPSCTEAAGGCGFESYVVQQRFSVWFSF